MAPGVQEAPVRGRLGPEEGVALRIGGRAGEGVAAAQTLVAGYAPGVLGSVWIGLAGPDQRLMVVVGPEPGRSPHVWHGPAMVPGTAFALQMLLHAGLGPGGVMLRQDGLWSSLAAASPWGLERLDWPPLWAVGHGQDGPGDRAFLGAELKVEVRPVMS
jgi:hypothetical protein